MREKMSKGRPIKIDWQESATALYQLYQNEHDLKKRQKLQFLWLVRQGDNVQKSCQIAGIGERSGQRYLKWYRDGGVNGLLAHKHGGHAPGKGFLTQAQQEAFKTHSESGAVKTVWDAMRWVNNQYGIEYSYEGMRGVMKRLGLSKKVPRPQHEKSDEIAQQAWKKGGLLPS